MGTAYIIAFMRPKLNARLKKDFTFVNVRYILMLIPSLPVENSKIAFPPKHACVFRLRAS